MVTEQGLKHNFKKELKSLSPETLLQCPKNKFLIYRWEGQGPEDSRVRDWICRGRDEQLIRAHGID
jgi:hypothetical protein